MPNNGVVIAHWGEIIIFLNLFERERTIGSEGVGRERERETERERERERERKSQEGFMPGTEPNTGLDPMTPGSRPESKSRVGRSTDLAVQALLGENHY